jgi:hypothetical protein
VFHVEHYANVKIAPLDTVPPRFLCPIFGAGFITL